jgi:hypothetical protein
MIARKRRIWWIYLSPLAILLVASAVFAAGASIEYKLSPDHPVVGLPLNLTVTVSGHDAPSSAIAPNFFREAQTTWVIPAKSVSEETRKNGDKVFSLKLVPLVPGVQPLPPLIIAFSDGTTTPVELRPVEVGSHLSADESSTNPMELSLSSPAEELIAPLYIRYIWMAAGVFLVTLIALLVYYLIRRSREGRSAITVKLPPDQWALAELDKLQQEDLLKQRRIKEFFSRLADIVRIFLGMTYGFEGLEWTTSELGAFLDQLSLPQEIKTKIIGLLEEADLVKFAKYRPDVPASERALQRAREIIREIHTLCAEHSAPHDSSDAPERRQS